MVVGYLIVTHGGLASELLATAQTIAGRPFANFRALNLAWTDGPEEARDRIRRGLEDLRQSCDSILILTDLHGDTPSKSAHSFRAPGHCAVLAGVNLPMVLRLGCIERASTDDFEELVRWIEIKGRDSIRRAGDVSPDSGLISIPRGLVAGGSGS